MKFLFKINKFKFNQKIHIKVFKFNKLYSQEFKIKVFKFKYHRKMKVKSNNNKPNN